jgi:hypothetical protein
MKKLFKYAGSFLLLKAIAANSGIWIRKRIKKTEVVAPQKKT